MKNIKTGFIRLLFLFLINPWNFALFAEDDSLFDNPGVLLGKSFYYDNKFVEAYNQFMPYAEKGDAEAQYYIGRILYGHTNAMNEWWKGIPKYAKKKGKKRVQALQEDGMYWLRKSIWQDHVPALIWAGKQYTKNSESERNKAQGAQWITRAANLGDPEGMYELARLYFYGTGYSRDVNKALEIYEKSGNRGYAPAMFELFEKYDNPYSSWKDEEKAIKWLDRAVAANYIPAFEKMGEFYAKGTGGKPQNTERAIYWYEKADTPEAKRNLEKLYAQREEEKELRELPGLSSLQAYEKGEVYYQNVEYKKALPFLTQSAEQGYSRAQFRLGYMYDLGKGVAQDYAEAMKWYRKAAAQGHENAIINIGVLYENGQGVAKSEKEAIAWYKKGADKGNKTAKQYLQNLTTSISEREKNAAVQAARKAEQSRQAQTSGSATGSTGNVGGAVTRTWRVDLPGGGYSEYTEKADGTLITKTVNTCVICHGSGTCGTCFGRGMILQSYFNRWIQCPNCFQTGRCRICQGNGRSEVVAVSDGHGGAYGIGKDGTVAHSNQAPSTSSSRNTSSGSSASVCDRCGGIGVDKFPVYEEDPAGAGSHATGMVGYTNYRGTKCQYCGKYSWHIHTKCTKCGYR